ncbi:MAG: FkbM family methyltransferase [Candidatus Nanohalobium sp.]
MKELQNFQEDIIFKATMAYRYGIYSKFSNKRGFTAISKLLEETTMKRICKSKDCATEVKFKGDKYYFSNNKSLKTGILDETEFFRAFLNKIRKKDVIYDVGSYHGLYAILGSKNKSYAFEIDPENIKTIQKNKELNSKRNITIKNAAVTNRNGVINFQSGKKQSNQIGKGTNKIKSITLDKFSTNAKDPDIIKIDVEGAELKVLEGSKKTIRRCKPTIFLELHQNEILKEFGAKRKEVLSLLRNLDYKIAQEFKRRAQRQIVLEPQSRS